MNDAFSFRAVRMPRRQIDPLALKAAVAAALVVAAVGVFAQWVIESERRSDTASSAQEAALQKAPADRATSDRADASPDADARAAATTALDAALAIRTRDGSFRGAGTAGMSDPGGELVFVEGPSTAPRIVSLAGTSATWAAAVMSSSGTCVYVRVGTDGRTTFGTGHVCDGAAALAWSDPDR